MFKESNDANKVFTIMAVNFAIVIRLLPSINKLVNAFNSNKFAKFSALEILKLAAKKNNLKKNLKKSLEKDINFKNVSFSHPKTKN